MRMNSLIALSGKTPDIVGSLDAGSTAGRKAGLSELYRQHGPGIAQGNQNSLAALATMDPQAALSVRDAHQGMQARNELMGQRRAASGRAAETHEAQMSAHEAQKALEQAIGIFSNARTPEEFDQLVRTAGHEDLVGQFGNRQALLMKIVPIEEQLRMQIAAEQPKAPPSGVQTLQWRAEQAGLKPGTAEYQNFMMSGGKQEKGMRFTSTPDGEVTYAEGVGVDGSEPVKKLTEKQSQLTLFGSMMDKTMPVINSLEEDFNPANLKDNTAARAGWAGNYFKSGDMQKYEVAGRAWAEGVLRLQTGAAATQPEIERVFATYFAQPGDSPETVTYKREIRQAFGESVGLASGGLVTPGESLKAAPKEPDAVEPFDPQTPDFTAMSDEELQAYIERGGS